MPVFRATWLICRCSLAIYVQHTVWSQLQSQALSLRRRPESFLDIKHLYIERMSTPNLTGVHTWLVLWKASKAVDAFALRSIESLGLGRSDFGVLEALLHKGALPVNILGKKVLL